MEARVESLCLFASFGCTLDCFSLLCDILTSGALRYAHRIMESVDRDGRASASLSPVMNTKADK